MSFNLEDFIAHVSKEELDSLLKPHLRQVVQRLKIEHEENAKKAELKHLILDYLVEEDLIPDDKLDSASSEVEIRQLELEHNAREQEKQKECQLKLKELELREKEIAAKKELDLKERELAMKKKLELKEKEFDMQLKLKELELKSRDTPVTKEASSSSLAKESFNFVHHVKLVPPFQEH